MNSDCRYIVEPYSAEKAAEWDDFVDRSRNATFILKRGYMDYHADRFSDCSLLIYSESGQRRRLAAMFAACSVDGRTVSAHAGLTYGGLILPVSQADGSEVLEMLGHIADYYRRNFFTRLVYKTIPHIYHRYPCEEDVYALFRLGARLTECNLSSAVELGDALDFNENSRRNMRRAVAAGVTVSQSGDYDSFWRVLETLLGERYGVRPVHSLEEIKLLASRFPDNIRLFVAAGHAGEIIAGTVLFVTPACVHAQYIAASPEGKQLGALPLIFNHIMSGHCGDARYFDFGTSNEDHGRRLNEGLIRQKNGMGGRGITYNIYEIDL